MGGSGTTRAEDAQATPTQIRISPSVQRILRVTGPGGRFTSLIPGNLEITLWLVRLITGWSRVLGLSAPSGWSTVLGLSAPRGGDDVPLPSESEAAPHVVPICDVLLTWSLFPPRRSRPGPGPHSEEGTTCKDLRTVSRKPGPESGPDCLTNAEITRQRGAR